MNKYQESFDQLINEKIEDPKIERCVFDGEPCGAKKSWRCEIPVYIGKLHNVIIDWKTCPRKRYWVV